MGFVLFYLKHFSGPADPVMVDGQYSKFSMIVMSTETRLLVLKVGGVDMPVCQQPWHWSPA